MKKRFLILFALILCTCLALFATSCTAQPQLPESESLIEELQSSESESLSEESQSTESEFESTTNSESSPTDEWSITFNTLSFDGKFAYHVVSNATTQFSFANEIKIYGNAKYIVALDEYGITTSATKTVPLFAGNNTIYLFVFVDEEIVDSYIVTIRRRPTYNVTFNSNGGTAITSQIIEEDSLATEPTTTRVGYTFTGWDYDFNKPITENTEITAIWSANKDTKYTVNYYLQNLDDDNYTLHETVELKGTTDTTAYGETDRYTHFTYNASKSTVSGNINGDGSRVLSVYYTRNKYTVTVTGGALTLWGAYKYGTEITSTATPYLCYEFSGWYSGEELLSTDTTYTFTADKNVTAKFAVKPEMSNFNFTSTTTTCTITGIKDKAVTEIVVPDYVTSISQGAFSGCTSLESITIPFVGATKRGTSDSYFGYIFGASSYSYNVDYVSTSLKKVTVTGRNILDGAFYNCSSLTSVVIGDSVTSIGDDAFAWCSSLTNVVIGDSVTSIGDDAFRSCSRLTSITIPDSVTSIGDSAFEYCYKLVEVVNKSANITVTKGSSANGNVGCYALAVYNSGDAFTSKLSDDNGYIVYTDGAEKILLGYNGAETDLVLPSYITTIYRYAFSRCSSLTSVVIPNSVTSIGDYAFEYCRSLMSVVIPNSVTSIGNSAFYSCSRLTSVVIGDSVTLIGNYAFSFCSCLTSITIPDSVTLIGDYAFSSCSSLTSVLIPDSVTSIGDGAFSHCSSLTSVVIGDSVTYIGGYAFSHCSSLTNVVIPNSVTSIGSSAFGGCSSLESITIPFVGKERKTATDTYQYPFGYIFGTSSYTGSKATEQSYYGSSTSGTTYTTYYIPTSLKSVTVTGGNILYGAFENCSSLTSVVIGDSVTSIGDSAFYYCNNLTSVVIGDSVTSIGDYAFCGCRSLTSVVIGDSVTSSGWDAFAFCRSLTSIKYRGTPAQWQSISKGDDWNYNTGSYTITFNYNN